MNTYSVTVVDRHRKRTRYVAIAQTLHEAWLTAVNQYGIAVVTIVKPFRTTRPA